MSWAFECAGITHVFGSPRGSVHALGKVDLRVRANEFICLVGPSGCGKTTLLKIIAGLLAPSSGEITFDAAFDNAALRAAMVFQEHAIFPWLNVLDNVAFGLEMRGMARTERENRARAFIENVGLGEFEHYYPHELSAGMRQRVGVARAFVSDAPILLMDEPFGALDGLTKRVLQNELLGLWARANKTVVFVTHDLDEAVRLADRVIVLSARPGVIVAEIPIVVPRPRDETAAYESVLGEMKWRIWKMLEQSAAQEPRLSVHAPA